MTKENKNDPTAHLSEDQRDFVNSVGIGNPPLMREEFDFLRMIATRSAEGNPVTIGELIKGGQEVASRPDHVNVWCPICGNEISIAVEWKTEKGEFGAILSEWPELSDNPEGVDQGDYCQCSFNGTLISAIAEYYNDGDRLYELLSPPAIAEGEKDEADLLFEWTQRVRDPWLFLKRLLNVYEAARQVRRLPSERNTYLLYLFNQLDEVDDETNRALQDLVDILSPFK